MFTSRRSRGERLAACALLVIPAIALTLVAQVPFEAAVSDLRNPDAAARLRAVRLLKPAAFPESAVPLAGVIVDPVDDIQLEAIAAVLNVFLADRIVPSGRRGLVLEARKRIAAEEVFSNGALELNTTPVPPEVLNALLLAGRDENVRVAVEALYAFGVLGAEAFGPIRQELLRVSGPQLVGMVGVQDPARRVAAVRVIGRLFARRPADMPIDEPLGDGVILALNDRNPDVQLSAMDALGWMRYERAVQALTTMYQFHRRNELGTGSFAALARIGHPSSAALFQDALTNANAVGKTLAVEGLARLGDATATERMRTALARERNDAVLLAEQFAAVMLSKGIFDPLFEALARPGLRYAAMQYLIEAAPGRSAAFTRAAQDSEPALRADVANILGLSYDPAALTVVQPLKQDKDPLVARAAERAEARLRRVQ